MILEKLSEEESIPPDDDDDDDVNDGASMSPETPR